MEESADRRILVTGASSGVGRELAIRSAAPGVSLWLLGRNRVRLTEVADRVRAKGASVTTVELDLLDLEAAGEFLRSSFPEGFRVDRVYLAAAITAFGEVRETLPEDWDRLYRMNLLSPVQMARHFYANMAKQGHGEIVLISSLAAYAGYPTATAYATMKAGLLGLHRSLWQEGRVHGVSVHHVSLGYVRTGIYKSAIYRKTDYESTMSSIRKMGLKIISPERAAEGIVRSVDKGRHDFGVPAYASLMKWTAPRFPFLIGLIHSRIMGIFRSGS